MNENSQTSSVVVAGLEVVSIVWGEPPDVDLHRCMIQIANKRGETEQLKGQGTTRIEALASAWQPICKHAFRVESSSVAIAQPTPESLKQPAAQESDSAGQSRSEVHHAEVVVCVDRTTEVVRGLGRAETAGEDVSLLIALIKALSHVGNLQASYSANNQKQLREFADELAPELLRAIRDERDPQRQELETHSYLVEFANRVASSSILTATNVTNADLTLNLYDTSAWLYDSRGRRRSDLTDTDLWSAWCPGLDGHGKKIRDILETLPKVHAKKLPWIVHALESPKSWLRFRGAISLEDHDVLHIVLGRGLQDQDEAFVLGFAMGTARRYSRLEHFLFRWLLANLYPEPYRIPKILLPAFDIGIDCGRRTGRRDLYRESFDRLLDMTVHEARQACEIDESALRQSYQEERRRIPFTIASLRLP